MFLRQRNNLEIRDTLSLAGWMFADLLLGMSMLFLVFNTVGQKPAVMITPTPTLTQTVTPSPLPPSATPTRIQSIPSTPTPLAPGLGHAQCYNLILNSKDVIGQKDSIVAQLKSQLPNDPKYKAGLVLVWAYGNDVSEGVSMASEIGKIIREHLPESFGVDTQFKSLYFSYGMKYHAQVEAYFFNTGLWTSTQEAPCGYTR